MAYRKPHPWFVSTLDTYSGIPDDFHSALWNYFAYGIEPGGFGMAVLSNDFISASLRAHSALKIETFQHLAKWLMNVAPIGSYGSPEDVEDWMAKTDEDRMDIMINIRLRPSEFDILAGHTIA
jgi:hypothetical protein